MAEPKKRLKISPATLVIAAFVLVGAGLFAYLTLAPRRPPPAPLALTPEAKAYLPYLQLTEVQPQTSESYIQKSLFEIIGKITNTGTRTLLDVEVTCVFHDYAGREIKRERASVVSRRGSALAPNGTTGFRLAFDDLPDEWNRQMPSLVIAAIQFQ